MGKSRPDFKEEKKLWNKGYKIVVGLDEVGRGAFAGPVLVGAVIFSQNSYSLKNLLDKVNDSKLLTPKLRKKLVPTIKKQAIFTATAETSVSVINKLGIGKATQMAFRKAIKKIREKFPNKRMFVLIDGFYVRYIRGIGLRNQKGIIKGDRKSISIAAASIIAKVERDSVLESLDKIYPRYGFAKNKGYGTKFHQQAIRKHGLCKFHRTSFNLLKLFIFVLFDFIYCFY